MQKLKERFPPGVDYRIIYDTTMFVKEAILSVMETIIEAFLLVVFVVLVFQKSMTQKQNNNIAQPDYMI